MKKKQEYRHCWNGEEIVEWISVIDASFIIIFGAFVRGIKYNPVQRIK